MLMPENDLKNDLQRLRDEIARMPASETRSRERLMELVDDLEQRASGEQQADIYDQLADRISSTIEHFESSHPRATAILNDIMVTLSNMGI